MQDHQNEEGQSLPSEVVVPDTFPSEWGNGRGEFLVYPDGAVGFSSAPVRRDGLGSGAVPRTSEEPMRDHPNSTDPVKPDPMFLLGRVMSLVLVITVVVLTTSACLWIGAKAIGIAINAVGSV